MNLRRSREAGRRLVGHARERLVRWQPEPEGGHAPVHLPEPEQREVYRILNFALRAGAVMLASGAGTVEVESTILDLTDACGLRGCEVDVTFTSMTASFIRGDDVEPVTTLQVVRDRAVDYSRLAAVHRLRDDLTSGRLDAEQAFARLEQITAARTRRGPWVLLGWSGMAAAFTVLLGGRALVASVAFVSTVVAYLANRHLARVGIPGFFQAMCGAAVATGFAMVLAVVHAPAATSLVVAGGIMILVPGYALVASVQDALTGFPISAGARGLEVLLTAAGIIAGVASVLYVSASAGFHVELHAANAPPFAELPLQVVAAGVAGVLYAAATFVPRRALVGAGGTAAVGWASYLLLRHGGVSLIAATALASLLVGITGQLLAERHRTHPFLYVVPGVMPLVPGLAIYQGMLNLVYGSNAGSATLLRAVASGLAIAAGVTLGNILVRPLRRPKSRRRPASP